MELRKPIQIDRALGCLWGGAIGDALGRPNEARTPPKRRIEFFEPWHGWAGGPKGTITDDTQLTMVLAESLVELGRFDPDDFARRMTSIRIRGIGSATRDFIRAYHANGGDWRRAAQPSAGNGAAMRAAPIGLLNGISPDRLRNLAAEQARVSHDDPMSAASSAAAAYAVALLARVERGALDDISARIRFLREVADFIRGMEDGKAYVTRNGGVLSTIYNRLAEDLPRHLEAGSSLESIQEDFWSGGYILESGPMAFACFLVHPEDFDEVVKEAACKTRDSDTVAAMAGNLAGAFVGASGIRKEWLDELEYREELKGLAARLVEINMGEPG
ncbi:MAG TPA: ADP-ribosylglycohydrolase family protein [Magnetospirillaceae bacterium]|nr:ADP-ribosylglycohydrolase family protein [Magnetospirillaceae bacterium]